MSRIFEATAEIDAETEAIIELGLNHEQQHQELIITDVKHLLGSNPCGRVPLDSTGGAPELAGQSSRNAGTTSKNDSLASVTRVVASLSTTRPHAITSWCRRSSCFATGDQRRVPRVHR